MQRSLALLALVLLPLATALAADDPPARVGRLSLLQGEVTFRNTATGESEPATLNWPVTGRNAIETGPRSRAEVRIGSSTVRIDGQSAIEFAILDDSRVALRVTDGTAVVRVTSRDQAGDFEITTPDARIDLADAGRYRIDSGIDPDTTAVTVLDGAARLETPNGVLTLRPGQRAEIAARGARELRVGEARRDEFDDWALARDRRDDAARSARYVSREMTGYEDLDEHGQWSHEPAYGPVWMPHAVDADWAPYRAGRWAWIEPWGWTWVDRAPWGFAPFHYGRWVSVRGAWGWVPGAIAPRPVYAPALVAWIGRPGWSIGVSIGSVPAVGWFPLAPREVYYPSHRASVNYVRNVNVTHVTNVTRIVNVTNVDVTRVNYANRHDARAVTVVPQQVVANGRPVGPAAIRVRDRRELASAPVSAAVPDANLRRARVEERAPAERRSERGDHDERRAAERIDGAGERRVVDARPRSEPRADREPAPAANAAPPIAATNADAPKREERQERRRSDGDERRIPPPQRVDRPVERRAVEGQARPEPLADRDAAPASNTPPTPPARGNLTQPSDARLEPARQIVPRQGEPPAVPAVGVSRPEPRGEQSRPPARPLPRAEGETPRVAPPAIAIPRPAPRVEQARPHPPERAQPRVQAETPRPATPTIAAPPRPQPRMEQARPHAPDRPQPMRPPELARARPPAEMPRAVPPQSVQPRVEAARPAPPPRTREERPRIDARERGGSPSIR